MHCPAPSGSGRVVTVTTDLASPPTAGIRLTGLTKSFRSPAGPVHAVRGVDLTVTPGETIALLGPNGAGKSTTIDLLLGLQRPDSGEVSLFGMTPDEAVRRGAIGAMLQTGEVLRDLSVRELVDMMASLYPRPLPVDDVVTMAGLTEVAERRTHRLSGGQTQRLRFAIAMVSDPDLLVLDEPTVALDVEARREFWSVIRSFAARGRTVVFATHYLDEADAHADRIVLMSRGTVVADGPATELKAMVGARTIRATLDVGTGHGVDGLDRLPGVVSLERQGGSVTLRCSDSDTALRALLAARPDARDLEVTGAGLEDAFLQLTTEEPAR